MGVGGGVGAKFLKTARPCVVTDIGEHDLSALAKEQRHLRCALTSGTAGDEGNLPLEPPGHGL
jgi:hypothetical protein